MPINIAVRYSSDLSSIFMARFEPRIFCLFHTFNCKLLAEIRAISELENKIEKNRPIKEIINSNIKELSSFINQSYSTFNN